MDEEEAQVPPAVPEARQLGHPAAGEILDLELAHLELLLGRPDHHLGCELHARRSQVELGQDAAAEGAHPAVRIGDAGAKQDV